MSLFLSVFTDGKNYVSEYRGNYRRDSRNEKIEQVFPRQFLRQI
jgi:hypothetical protein